MAAYVAGDRRAFEQLFARLAPRLHRFFRRSFSAEATADDLLQVTFLKLHRARDTYKVGMPVARVLGTTEGAVKLRAFRAYGALRQALAPLAPSGQGGAP